MSQGRYLVIIADDFGIGPETSRGILDLACRGLVTGSVLLANSPYAEGAVTAWRQAGRPMELGWHPCLTLDGPILPPEQVPTLVNRQGTFWPLATFLKRLFLGWISPAEIEAELRAQLHRFRELMGQAPTLVNAHHHVNLFHPVGTILLELLGGRGPAPYVRRIQEPWRLLARVGGARGKRLFLTLLGRPLARLQKQLGFPGNHWLMGLTDPRRAREPNLFSRWLSMVPGEIVEMSCHPGHWDTTPVGRDCKDEVLVQKRVDEFKSLTQPGFLESCRQAGLVLVSPAELSRIQVMSHAA